jgi:hypothetical protein
MIDFYRHSRILEGFNTSSNMPGERYMPGPVQSFLSLHSVYGVCSMYMV